MISPASTWRKRALARTLMVAACWAAGLLHAEPLRIAVAHGTVSLPMYVAEAQGFFAREGVDVRMETCASGRDCFAMLLDGQAQAATAAELLVALHSLGPADVAVLATLSASVHHIKIIGHRDAALTAPHWLEGKRVGTPRGTSAEYFLYNWLVYHDINPQLVTVAPVAPGQLISALERHEVDAIAIWEPVASGALKTLGERAVALPNPRLYTQHFNLVVKRNTIGAQEQSLLAVLRALQRASRFIAEQPEQSRRILAVRVRDETGIEDLSTHNFQLQLDQSLITTMEAQARWAIRQGYAKAPPAGIGALLHSIEPDLLRRVAPEAVNLVR